MKPKFKVYDIYEGKEVLGYAENLQEVHKLKNKRIGDTDGECYVVYAQLNPESGKYTFSKYKPA